MENNIKIAQISTSRGCSGRCSFCSSQLFWGKWKGRSTKSIADEIEHIVSNYNVKIFNFIDSSFEDPGFNYARVQTIAEEIVKRDLNISFLANVRGEFHKKTDGKLMEILKQGGLCCVFIGVESGNEFDQKLYNKRATVEDNIKTIELFKEYDIIVQPGFINFNPYSTFEGLRENIEFLGKYKLASDLGLIHSRFRMYIGTNLYNKVKADGLLKDSMSDDELAYSFVDERIGTLSEFVSEYLNQDNEMGIIFNRIENYCSIYLIVLAHYKRVFSSYWDYDACKLVSELEQFINIKREAVSNFVSQWFKQLLELAEKGWNDDTAAAISHNLLNEEYIKEIVASLDNMKNKIHRKLLKLNPEYYVHFISSF